MRVARRQQAAARAVEVAGNIESAQQRHRLFVSARGPHLLTVKDRRALGIDKNVSQFLDVARVADRLRRRPVVARLRHHSAVSSTSRSSTSRGISR
jgi:hypothetical protein